jgi:hypothetical protein
MDIFHGDGTQHDVTFNLVSRGRVWMQVTVRTRHGIEGAARVLKSHGCELWLVSNYEVLKP